MHSRWSGAPTQICGWSFGNLKKDWMIFYSFYKKETSVREASGRGGIPQVSPLLERDLQVDWQQLQRELWEGSSRSSQLRKRQDPNVSFWRCSTETLNKSCNLPLGLFYIVAGLLVLGKTLRIPDNQITMNVHLRKVKHTLAVAMRRIWLEGESFNPPTWLPKGGMDGCKEKVRADEWYRCRNPAWLPISLEIHLNKSN